MSKGEKIMALEKTSLTSALNKLQKAYGGASVFKGSENISVDAETLSSGCLAVDQVLRVGGLPLGRIIEVSGNEGSGKTIFCASVIAEWQKQGKRCAFIDAEHAADKNWFEKIGVDWDGSKYGKELIFARPDNLEEALDIIHTLAGTGEVDLIVWDSVPALPSLQEEKTAAGEVKVASIAKVLTPALRRLTPVFGNNNCTGIFINQIREKIGVMFGNPETTPGGKALKFGASLRLQMGKVGSSDIKDPATKLTIGHRIRVRSLKNKLSNAQGVVTEFTLFYDTGIDHISDAIDTALLMGDAVIKRPSKVMYHYRDLEIKGRDNFIEAIRENEELFNTLVSDVREKLFSSDFGDTVSLENSDPSDEDETA